MICSFINSIVKNGSCENKSKHYYSLPANFGDNQKNTHPLFLWPESQHTSAA